MLHYGFFEDANIDAECISIKQIEDAQIKYAQNIIDLIVQKYGLVLDVGCGMGGLSAMLLQNNYEVEALTPNKNQKKHINKKYKDLVCHNCKFEDFVTDKKYNTIVNSESLQYINLDVAIHHINKILDSTGQWIVVDYFRLNEDGINKSGHFLNDFTSKISTQGWKITYQQDITLNVLPTIKFLHLYAERFLVPLKHFAFEKLRFKKAWLYCLTEKLQAKISSKMDKEFAAINPEKFLAEKKYMLFVIKRG